MGYILILMLIGGSQSSMAAIEFTDKKSCEAAGRILVEEVSKKSPVFNSLISYRCIQVNGLR